MGVQLLYIEVDEGEVEPVRQIQQGLDEDDANELSI